MKIGVLGASGQVGSALVAACQRRQLPYLALARQEVDVTQAVPLENYIAKAALTHLINCSGYTQVDQAEKESELAFAVNADAPRNLARLAKKYRLQLLHLSTDYVFGGEQTQPYLESDIAYPLSIYGKSKRAGEQAVLEEYPEAVVLRTSWIFGPQGKNFISCLPTWMQKKEKIEIYSNEISRPTYAPDLAEVALKLLGSSGLFHFANRDALSRYQIACDFLEIAKELKLPWACREVVLASSSLQLGAQRPIYSVLNTHKIEAHLACTPRPWKTILREYFRYAV